ncbi:hypothetical protein GCM10017674_67440 [Streptomyces gardneri]|uniref:Knr4/Smi1-like domain-containing protein n=1 Tax=Streptomyces gardneri TaxID=66892 RepID=A0A4Y3RH67_9ACTN|nr:hypothetical protein SGA01_26170 [Streptomyces gardneri]GHH16923.1 hypothetical protein GCM10017674_67440 [Streptomyces gardneri]
MDLAVEAGGPAALAGDQFAFVQTPQRPDIFVWEHETASCRWVAGDLMDWLFRSLSEGGDDWYR